MVSAGPEFMIWNMVSMMVSVPMMSNLFFPSRLEFALLRQKRDSLFGVLSWKRSNAYSAQRARWHLRRRHINMMRSRPELMVGNVTWDTRLTLSILRLNLFLQVRGRLHLLGLRRLSQNGDMLGLLLLKGWQRMHLRRRLFGQRWDSTSWLWR